jgi:hypothetical protein
MKNIGLICSFLCVSFVGLAQNTPYSIQMAESLMHTHQDSIQVKLGKPAFVALPLTEMSAKIRSGGAINVPEDEGAPYWSGYVPLTTVAGVPVTNEDSGAPIPEVIRKIEGSDLHQ